MLYFVLYFGSDDVMVNGVDYLRVIAVEIILDTVEGTYWNLF